VSRLAAIVLNWRTAPATLACVRSLSASKRRPDRLIVVDNGSGASERAALTAALPPGVELLEAERNLGFSGGCNLGLRAAIEQGAELLLVANSDVIADPNAIGALESALAGRMRAGMAAPLVTTGQPPRIESRGIAFSPRSGRMRLRDAQRPLDGAPTAIEPVDAATGAFLLIRRAVIERIGAFDEAYFYGFEDVDLCLRARQAGFEVLLVGRARVAHASAASIGERSPRRVYFATRNHLRLLDRAVPLPAPWSTVRAGWVLGLNLAHALTTSPAPLGAGLRAFARGAWDHWRGRYGDDR
jgi:GT2 family glycosyltransferase